MTHSPPIPTPSAASSPSPIAVAMEARGMTLAELAAASGIRPAVLAGLLSGKRRMGVATARKLAPVFGDNPAALIRRDRAPDPALAG